MSNLDIIQAAMISKDIYGSPFTIRTLDADMIAQKRFSPANTRGWRRIINIDHQIDSNKLLSFDYFAIEQV